MILKKRRAYYPLSSITTSQYTKGNELIIDDVSQNDYVGLYHILPNGEYWSEAIPHDDSIRLILKKFKVQPDVKQYNVINRIEQSNYISPIPYYPLLTPEDYTRGFVMRYFVQKRNNPLVTITEIDGIQYNSLNRKNNIGISMGIWNYVEIKWTLRGVYAQQLNLQEIKKAEEHGFKNLSNYLKEPLEFFK